MTLEELDKDFAEFDPKIVLYPETATRHFKSVADFKSFIEKEVEYWSKMKRGEIESIYTHFSTIADRINSALSYVGSSRDLDAKEFINQAIQLAKKNSAPGIYSKTAFAVQIQMTFEKSEERASGLLGYHRGYLNQSYLYNKKYFEGCLDGYILENIANIQKEKNQSEIFSLAKERETFHQERNKIEAEFTNLFEKNKSDVLEHLENLNAWREETKDHVKTFLEKREIEYDKLTKTYEEHLRLKGPARYWSQLSRNYEKVGKSWRNGAISISILTVILLISILYETPESFKKVTEIWSMQNIKGTVTFGLIFSTLVFTLQFFIKMSLSSYHLSRDAKERSQLTYVYLSLLKKEAISDSEKSIVMQSLFSRADTGLLKGEHQPVLPTSLLNNIGSNPKSL